MRVKPNEDKVGNAAYQKNDLYRKFKIPFEKLLHKDFNSDGQYSRRAYVTVSEHLEQNIIDILDGITDCITPIIGYTGIGKTHLLISTLKNYYDNDYLTTNQPFVFCNNGEYDIVMYCAHERYQSQVLVEIENLLNARIMAICATIEEELNIKVPDTEVDAYIWKHKKEISFYF